MGNITIETIILPVIISIAGSLIVFYYLGYRARKIRLKIEDLESEEEYLEKLSKGNIKLLRSTFLVLLAALSFFFLALVVVFAGLALEVTGSLKNYTYWTAAWLIFISAGICFQQARSIAQLKDLNKSKQALQQKREKLEAKLQ